MKSTHAVSVLAARLFVVALVLTAAIGAVAADPHALSLTDILSWKGIRSSVVSNDGAWFAYILAPNEGDSEVVVRNIKDGKETKFAVGELPAGPGFNPFAPPVIGGGPVQFSEDSQWVAFSVHPTVREAKKNKKDRKPSQDKVVLVQLASGSKTEFDKIRKFSFSGERGGFIAMQRYGADAAPGAGGPPAAAAPGAPAAPARATGSDLLLRELATGDEQNIGNVSEFAFDKKGDFLAYVVDAQEKAGNGIQLRNMANGAVTILDSGKANYKSLNWTREGGALAALKGVEDKGYEDKLYTVLGWKNLDGKIEKAMFDPKKESGFPKLMTVSPDRKPFWMEDLSAIAFGVHEIKAKKEDEKKGPAAGPAAAKDTPDSATLILWHWKDKRLPSQQQVEEPRDKTFSYLSLYRVADKKFVRLADESVRDVTLAPEQAYAVGVDRNQYERMGNLDGRRYSDIYTFDLKTGDKKLAKQKVTYFYGASPEGTKLAWYEDGHFYAFDIASGTVKNVSKDAPVSFINTEDDHNVVKPPTRFMGWAKGSDAMLVSDNWDIWKISASGGKAVNLTGNGKKDSIRYQQRYRIDPEERAIDLSEPQYFSSLGEYTKKGGFVRVDPAKPGAHTLIAGDAAFGGLKKAKSADVWLYTRETPEEYPDWVAASASLTGGHKITDANPQQRELLWTKGVKIIDYVSAKGDKLQGALYLPAGYEPGKKYPTVVYIYEKLSQGANTFANPSTGGGFNRSVYTSSGYAVLTPDITYKVNDPGMSAVWCLEPAVKAAVATGIVDPKKVGLHGHSWGGYQTAFMVTQTDIFKAAVAGAPLTDMVSMYSSIYWNTGSANQPIFESSQGRFTAGYWEIPEAYIRNSPVYHAKNVHTPLMILHNDKDGAVDFTQGIEYFNTLRRLEKPVVMLEYKGENHGLREPKNMKDYAVRMKEYFDYHLMDKPAPNWLSEGVPWLQMKEHLEKRAEEQQIKPAPAPPVGGGAGTAPAAPAN
ncbi:MAG: prolyl oligopeptidase family serine peptidase [Bryobacteraceae bacterium]